MLSVYKYPTFSLLSRFHSAAPCTAPALGCLASSTHSSPSNKAKIYHSNLTEVLDRTRLPSPYVLPYLDSVTCIMFSSSLAFFVFFLVLFFRKLSGFCSYHPCWLEIKVYYNVMSGKWWVVITTHTAANVLMLCERAGPAIALLVVVP